MTTTDRPPPAPTRPERARPSPRDVRLPRAYWLQWTSTLISNLGDGINFAAMPLLALAITSDERLLALTTAATMVPWLLVAVPAGVAVDRFDRKRLMIVANLVRVVLFGLVAVLAARGSIEVLGLLALLLLIGGCEVVFDSSAQAFLPMIVPLPQLARANGLLFAAEVLAGSIAGLSLGALLFDLDVGLPFAVNAASFAVAAALLVRIRVRSTDAGTPLWHAGAANGGSVAREPVEPAGVVTLSAYRWLRTNRLLWVLAWMLAITNLGLMFGQGIFAKFAVDVLELDNLGYGLMLAITAIGAATGGLVGDRIIDRIGLRWSVLAPYFTFGIGMVLIGAVPVVSIVAICGFATGFGISVWNIATITLRQELIPGHRFGRVNSLYRWMGSAAAVIGILAGGLVAYTVGLRAPFLVGGAITLAAAAVFGRPVLARIPAAGTSAT